MTNAKRFKQGTGRQTGLDQPFPNQTRLDPAAIELGQLDLSIFMRKTPFCSGDAVERFLGVESRGNDQENRELPRPGAEVQAETNHGATN